MRQRYIIAGIVLILLGNSFGILARVTIYAVAGSQLSRAGDALAGQIFGLPV